MKTHSLKYLRRALLFTLLSGLVFVSVWLVNLIWFRPFFISQFYDRIFIEYALDDPELISRLRLPVLSGFYNDELTDISEQKQRERRFKLHGALAVLRSYDQESQSEKERLNTAILDWYLASQAEGEKFAYHDYPVNQFAGIQIKLIAFMETIHEVKDKEDAEAYISRLSRFGTKISQLMEGLKIREGKGIIPPKFVLEKVVEEVTSFIGAAPEKNILYQSFKTKLDGLAIEEDEKTKYLQEVHSGINTVVYPAYAKLAAYLSLLRKKSGEEVGVWRLPDGEEYYKYLLKTKTTCTLDPEEVFSAGLSEVEAIRQQIYFLVDSLGYGPERSGSVSEWMSLLHKDPRLLYPADEEGKRQCLMDYQRLIDSVSGKIRPLFSTWPSSGVLVKPVSGFREDGSEMAYYEPPSMDGSRPGVFFANLRNMKQLYKYRMPTLVYHEAIPGHHLQLSLQKSMTGVPLFRKAITFTSYIEGWAFYAERCAWEYGMYDHDPFGNLGRLQAEMLRAVRLVVDVGIHYKRWSRQQAKDYLMSNTGLPEEDAATETDRYIVWPGQACTYKIGQMKILELRERARTRLKEKFSIAGFHDAVMRDGAMPLAILDRRIDEYIENSMRSAN